MIPPRRAEALSGEYDYLTVVANPVKNAKEVKHCNETEKKRQVNPYEVVNVGVCFHGR